MIGGPQWVQKGAEQQCFDDPPYRWRKYHDMEKPFPPSSFIEMKNEKDLYNIISSRSAGQIKSLIGHVWPPGRSLFTPGVQRNSKVQLGIKSIN